ncbi:hypothetical protein BY996DRAFT_7264676 [Phakopsora pachyrhizi]|nr:hypothetical protein BY996DRAFT_7264676 [Phakopsora pachyrhizi]
MSKRAAVEREMVAQMAQRAAEDDERQRLQQYQDLESEKRRLLAEADLRLQQIREEVAAVEKKHRDDLAQWEERERRAIQLELEAEAKAKAREAAEEARAAERERELEIERAATLERLKQEAIEEYRKVHDEVRRTQEEQLRKELEEARQKILEESTARKEALEKEREATIAKLKEEAQKEYRKHLDEQMQLDKERSDALKEASDKAAREFKQQQQEAIRSLYTAAGEHYLPPVQSSTATIPFAGPIPPDTSPRTKQSILKERRQVLREGLPQGTKFHQPAVDPRSDYWIRSAPQPHRVIGISPSSTWGTPAQRPRANSIGQTNMGTPFALGSTRLGQLNYSHIPTQRVGGMHSGAYQRSMNSSWKINPTCSSAHPIPQNSLLNDWNSSSSKPSKYNTQAYHQNATAFKHKATQPPHNSMGLKPFQCPPLKEEVESEDPNFCVVTLTSVPGFEMSKIFGEVFGVALRDIPDFTRPKDMTMEEQELMLESAMTDRTRAVNVMIRQAKRMGANCVIGLAFETHPLSPGSAEIWAIGTAVKLVGYDQTAVLPNSIEQATRTALENQRQGILPGQSNHKNEKPKGAEVEDEKKKNKQKKKSDKEQQKKNTNNSNDQNEKWGNNSNCNDQDNSKNNADDEWAQPSNGASNSCGQNPVDSKWNNNASSANQVNLWDSNDQNGGYNQGYKGNNESGNQESSDNNAGYNWSLNPIDDSNGEPDDSDNNQDSWGQKPSKNSANCAGWKKDGYNNGNNPSNRNNCNSGDNSKNQNKSNKVNDGEDWGVGGYNNLDNSNNNKGNKNKGTWGAGDFNSGDNSNNGKSNKNGGNEGRNNKGQSNQGNNSGNRNGEGNNSRKKEGSNAQSNTGSYNDTSRDGWSKTSENINSNEAKNTKVPGKQNGNSKGPSNGLLTYPNYDYPESQMIGPASFPHSQYPPGMNGFPEWAPTQGMVYRHQFGGLYSPMYPMPGGWQPQVHGPIYVPQYRSNYPEIRPESMAMVNTKAYQSNFDSQGEAVDGNDNEETNNWNGSYPNRQNYHPNSNQPNSRNIGIAPSNQRNQTQIAQSLQNRYQNASVPPVDRNNNKTRDPTPSQSKKNGNEGRKGKKVEEKKQEEIEAEDDMGLGMLEDLKLVNCNSLRASLMFLLSGFTLMGLDSCLLSDFLLLLSIPHPLTFIKNFISFAD